MIGVVIELLDVFVHLGHGDMLPPVDIQNATDRTSVSLEIGRGVGRIRVGFGRV